MTVDPLPPGMATGRLALHITRGMAISFACLAFGLPVFNIVNNLVQVDVQKGSAPALIGLPSWVPVVFSIIPLAMLFWTWGPDRFYPDLYATIGLAAVVIPVTGTMYRGWWALPVGGLTLVLLAARSVTRRRRYRAAEAHAAAQRAERRADRARRQLRGAADPHTQRPSGSPPRRRKRARGRP